MGVLARFNAVGQECPTYILRLDKALGAGLVYDGCAGKESGRVIVANIDDSPTGKVGFCGSAIGVSLIMAFARMLAIN